MSETIVYREYEPADFDKYKQLYRAVFSKEMSAEHFKWKFQSGDMNAIIFCAVTETGDLVGSRVVLITKVSIGDQVYQAAQSVDSMVHPDFQGRGIYKQLNLHAIDALKKKDISMIITFPNHNSLPPLEKLGWKRIAPISIYAKVLRYQSLAGSKKYLKLPLRALDRLTALRSSKFTFELNEVNKLDESHLAFIKDALSQSVHQNRSEEFLQWKYTEKPESRYVKVVFSREDAIQGLGVIRIDENGTRKTGIVTEFITKNDHIKKEMLDNLVSYCKGVLGLDVLKMWEVEDLKLSTSLKKNHFIKKSSSIWFSIKYLNESAEEVTDASKWYIAWGDADTA
ncbi:GNAT family N-acetyltransferase [Alkalihalobacillus sp. CinArs1]|uniref:GNAT family N-acetyltransferase n=1 Tax=Alkalihalobacillus sp. CinArs1 TaxID=2995314 RepID=UPI0022DE391E|nr:GNAT family N-acetyltransferase [Alkalihalobacillus sp. CinArs1]